VGEFVDHLALEGFVVMGQDWGGPIGMAVCADRADRVRGLVLGNTWFWSAESLSMRAFSRIMSTGPVQQMILERNLFVERLMPIAMARKLTPNEMDHYRKTQPSPEARRGVAEMPRQILAARPLLERLARQVPERLGEKPALLVWGMKDLGFRPKSLLPKMRSTFPDHEVVELPRTRHYIQEDAPDETRSPSGGGSASSAPQIGSGHGRPAGHYPQEVPSIADLDAGGGARFADARMALRTGQPVATRAHERSDAHGDRPGSGLVVHAA
jgi:pimeloyl-ACP methyl ester carboxylesterase